MNFPTVQSGLRRCEDIPIGLTFVVLSPAVQIQHDSPVNNKRGECSRACHVHIIHVSTIFAGLEHKDLQIWILRQTASNDGATDATAMFPSQSPFSCVGVYLSDPTTT